MPTIAMDYLLDDSDRPICPVCTLGGASVPTFMRVWRIVAGLKPADYSGVVAYCQVCRLTVQLLPQPPRPHRPSPLDIPRPGRPMPRPPQ